MTEPMPDIPSRFNRILGARWVDKAIALVAVLPFVLAMGFLVYLGDFDIPRLVVLMQLAVLALTLVVRRPPVRVTTNPVFWLLAFLVTYWPLLISALDFEEAGAPLTPTWLSNGVALLSLAVSVWARLSLGRNIGFVPAERQIGTTGAYAYVRHPIYSGIFIVVLASELSASPGATSHLTCCGVDYCSSRPSSKSGFFARTQSTPATWNTSGGGGRRALCNG